MTQTSGAVQVHDPQPTQTPRACKSWAIAVIVVNALIVVMAVAVIIVGALMVADPSVPSDPAPGTAEYLSDPFPTDGFASVMGLMAIVFGVIGLAVHGTVLGLTVEGLRRARRGQFRLLRAAAIAAVVVVVLQAPMVVFAVWAYSPVAVLAIVALMGVPGAVLIGRCPNTTPVGQPAAAAG